MPRRARHTQAVLTQAFEAGSLSVLLRRIDLAQSSTSPLEDAQQGPWLLAGARVVITEGWVPADPLHTWHDTAPFADDHDFLAEVGEEPDTAPAADTHTPMPRLPPTGAAAKKPSTSGSSKSGGKGGRNK